MKRLKVLASVCGLLVLMLAGIILVAKYMFPTEDVRRQLEHTLSAQLQSDVRIASLEWELLSGIRLGAVDIERDGAHVADVDGLVLRYDLRHLLRGTLSVNELKLARAHVFIDLAHMPVKPEEDAITSAQTPITLPTLPLSVDIETIRIEESHIGVTDRNGLRITLHNIDLTAGFRAGSQGADISGIVDVADIELILKDQQWRLPLHLDFALKADFPAERLVIDHVSVRSDPVMSLSLNGQLDHIVSSREITLSIQEGHIDLERLLPLAQPFLSPPLADIRLAGTITPQVTIKGRQTGEGFHGTVKADLRGTDIQGTIPALKLSIEPTSFHVHAAETLIHSNLPRAIRADVSINSMAASLETSSVRNLVVGMQVGRDESGQLSTHVTMTGVLSAVLPSSMQSITEPVSVEIDASGDETHMTFTLPKATARIGHMLDLVANGKIGASTGGRNERPFALNATVETDMAKLLSILPRSAMKGITLASGNGRQKLSLNLTGALDPAWHPQEATVDASLGLSGLRTASVEQQTEGTLDRLGVEMRATYGSRNGLLKGTLHGVMGVRDLKQGASLAVRSASLTFSGELNGPVTREMVVRRLTAAHRMELETHGIRYTTPGLTGNIDRVHVSSLAHADVTEGTYVLDFARLTAGALLDCTIKGEFLSGSRQFAVDFAVPSLNVAELRNHLSGPDIEALGAINPSGHLSLHAGGSGMIPRPEQIAELQIPVKASIDLNLRDVAGSFGNNAVAGATGIVRISMDPNPHPLISTSWQVSANRLDMGGDAPIKRLEGLTVRIEASAEEFDRIMIDRLTVGADGAEATLEGELSGIKGILTRKGAPSPTLLGPAFIKIHSSANLDLDQFQDTVRSYGLVGSGRAGFSMSLVKREHGALAVHLRLLPRRVSLTKDSNHVEELDGAIEIRKVLQWIPSLGSRTPDASFSPTQLLPDLRAASPSRQDLRIRQVEAGALQIRDLSAGLFFDRNRFVLQDLAMTVLGGGLGGEVVLTGGKGFGLNMRLEAARLDMNRLLPQGEQIQGDSLVDGTLNALVVFDGSSGLLDLGGSTLNLSLSRIGRDGLDRVLHFLDPKGSNPSIVGARSAVKLANPSTAQVTLSKGLVGLQILFQEGLLSQFKMDRIPVAQIKQVQNLTQRIPQWDMIRRVMEMLGSERYGVDQAGEFVLE